MSGWDSLSHALGTDGSSDGGGLLTTLVKGAAIYYSGGLIAPYLASAASIALAETAISGALIVNAAYGAVAVAELYAFSELTASASPVAAAQAQGMLINTSSNVAPIPVIYGYRRVGGTRVLTQVSGANNEYLHVIIVLCEGEIDSAPNIYIDNVLSTDAKFTGLVTTYIHTGTDTQAADANLIADLPAIWGSAYPGSGVAYIYAKLKYASTAFSGFPTITADVLGIKTYDPRTGAAPLGDVCLIAAIGNITDTTGASISTGVVQPTTAVSGQTWSQTYPAGYPVQTGVANPGSLAANQTWLQVRANPALCIRDYLTNTRYGRGISASLIDDASIIAAANYCDAMVTIPGGTQARYTCNGVVNVDSTAFDNIKLLLASCRAMLVYSAGKYKLICDAAQSSTFSFNEDNITGAWSIATAGRATKLNRVTAQFYDPASNWQPNYAISESTAYRSAQDNGLVLEAQASLAFTCNLYTAQQLAGLQLKQSRFGLVVSFKAFQVGLRCEVGDVVDITHSTPGWSGKLFRITQITILDTEEVEIVASEYDATVYALDTLTAVAITPTLSLPNPFNVGAPTMLLVASQNIANPDGTIISRMVASWTAAADAFITGYEIAWSENSGPWDTTICTGVRWVIPASATGRSYDVRVRSVNAIGAHSAWLTVTGTVSTAPTVAPAAPTLAATGAVFSVYLAWTFGDSRTDIRGVEVWFSVTDDRSAASRLALQPYPIQEYNHVGLAPGAGGYYWARTVDTFGNYSPWNPLGSIFGVYAVSSKDTNALLTQLNNSIGLSQLTTSLAAPISLITAPATTPGSIAAVQALATTSALTATTAVAGIQAQINGLTSTAPYSATTSYPVGSMVTYLGGLYQCIAAASAGILPTDVAYWVGLGAYSSLASAVAANANALAQINTVDGSSTSAIAQAVAALLPVSAGNTAGLASETSSRVLADQALTKSITTLASRFDDASSGLPATTATVNNYQATQTSINTAVATAWQALSAWTASATDNVLGNAADIKTTNDTITTKTSALAASITTLQANGPAGYAAVKTTVTASSDAITGLQANYTLKVDAGGRVAGISLATDSTLGSSVVFLADKFAFVSPDGTGTPKYVMTMGTIGGVSTLGFNGNAIFDGSVLAKSLSVTSLSAVTANLGTVTAGRAQNAANTNFVDFNASGVAPFLQVGNNVSIDAAGNANFSGVVISRNMLVASGTVGGGANVDGFSAIVDTGVTVAAWSSSETYVVVVSPAGGEGGGVWGSYNSFSGSYPEVRSTGSLIHAWRWMTASTIKVQINCAVDWVPGWTGLAFGSLGAQWNLYKVT